MAFKKGDKFILEIGDRQIDKYKIAGTDAYISIDLLKKLPTYASYEPEEEWISCDDDVPKKPSVVYCYCYDPKIGGRWTETLSYNNDLWCKTNGEVFDYKVLAWYPLPKSPYKEKNIRSDVINCRHCDYWYDVIPSNLTVDNKIYRFCHKIEEMTPEDGRCHLAKNKG